MIVHQVTVRKRSESLGPAGEHKRIYVGCAAPDVRYRDMVIHFRHRVGMYTKNTFEYITEDRGGVEFDRWKQRVAEQISQSDGMMMVVGEHTENDTGAEWEIECALTNGVPVVGIEVRKTPGGVVPKQLEGRMTRFGWEWFVEFIDGL